MAAFELAGLSLLGDQLGNTGETVFHGLNPATGAALPQAFHSASAAEVDRAAELAAAAAPVLARLDGAGRARLLRAIADGLEAARGEFEQLVPLETALPQARASGELSRTIGQLRLFAELVAEGSWVDARIEHGDPARLPLPKPDLRSMQRALGPVVVFGASNFPLAFSVAGGDTASALAAGCPVIVKAHPAHPATGELAGRVIRAAVAECGLPAGTFSLLFDAGHAVGTALVRHHRVRAVAFTGSLAGGRALMDLAAARPDPIPVYAELGSINPVFVLTAACARRGAAIANQLFGSVLQGVGQFCTCPGLLVIPNGEHGDALCAQLAELFASAPAAPMLAPAIAGRFAVGVRALADSTGVQLLAGGSAADPGHARPALLQVQAADFLTLPTLQEEVFGPATLIVRVAAGAPMRELAAALHGQLTATLIADPEDLAQAATAELLEALAQIAGRVLLNGVPTGVEVSPAMQHGGPWPASSDARSTSVGTAAIERFVRRICYQNLPDTLLPAALREANPLGLWRLVDGQRER